MHKDGAFYEKNLSVFPVSGIKMSSNGSHPKKDGLEKKETERSGINIREKYNSKLFKESAKRLNDRSRFRNGGGRL